MSQEPDIDSYLRESASWDADRAQQAQRSERLAWRIAAVAAACAAAGSGALLMLMPLKRVDPFVVRVDNTTGVVDVVPAYDVARSMDEAVTRYFLTHYVTVCERFDYPTAESDYEECGAFHTAERNQAWYARWDRNNPASPLNLHRDGSSVRAQVESVSFLRRSAGAGEVAQVRYLKAVRPATGAPEAFTHWIATIQYAYGPAATDPRTRRWNPLGFRVIDMRTEAEVREPEIAAAAPRTQTDQPR